MEQSQLQPNKAKKGRKWNQEMMNKAFKDVKCGRLSLSAAAKHYCVPRMSLSDLVKGRVNLNSHWGKRTALSKDEEDCLVQYIEFMAKRGFPLTVGQIIGFAWCIAKERGKDNVFKKSGPSMKWWRGFKERHPHLRLRRPDSLDRGRASMGNVHSLKEYFSILKDTLDANKLSDKPHLIFNCDEAAINLNKSAGQRVVVPRSQKHTHSISAATSEHITVHCCVNAAGGSLPPMIIFTKSFPGGAYHRTGPVNATYATSDTGFMDSHLYHQWFEKTFLKFAPAERPLLLIQDGASSHVSCDLVRSAIAEDVILLCLPPKTTHITQPLDVAVYRKMKIEAANIMSQAKLIKSDLWVSKKNVSSMFRLIFEKSFTMQCITEGFRKCGIYPFDPNAVDKSLLLRSCDTIDEGEIDLSVSSQINDESDQPPIPSDDLIEPLASSSPKQVVQQTNGEDDPRPNSSASSEMELNTNSLIFDNLTFNVDEDGILNLDLSTEVRNDVNMEEATEDEVCSDCPPELALAAVECSLTPRKKRRYHECLNFNVDLPDDNIYQTWKMLKSKVESSRPIENTMIADDVPNDRTTKLDCPELPQSTEVASKSSAKVPDFYSENENNHPLVKAGLISEDLARILVTPSFDCKPKSNAATMKRKARILTSEEVQEELIEKEKMKKEKEEAKKKNKEEKQLRKIEKAVAEAKRKEEIRKKKEERERIKDEKEKLKKEKEEAKKSKKAKVNRKDVCQSAVTSQNCELETPDI